MKRFLLALAVVAAVVLSASTGNAQERHGGSNYYRSYTNSRGPIHSNHSSYSRNDGYSRGGSAYRSNYDPSCRPNYGGYSNHGHSSYYRGGSSYYRSGYSGYGYGDYGYGYGSPYGSRGISYSNGGVFLYYGF